MTFGPYGATPGPLLHDLGRAARTTRMRRISYTGSANRAPDGDRGRDAHATAPCRSTVNFDGSASTRPRRRPAHLRVGLRRRLAPRRAARARPTPTRRPAHYTATLTVATAAAATDTATVRIDAGNHPPAPRSRARPPASASRSARRSRSAGTATDPEDGPLPAAALTWMVIRHHDTHTHPFLPPTTGNDVQITAPAPEDIHATAHELPRGDPDRDRLGRASARRSAATCCRARST